MTPLNEFLVCLRVSDEVTDLQEKVLLAMMGFGFSPYLKDEEWQYERFFTNMWELGERWMSLLYPYEEEVLQPYINTFKPNITADISRKIINSFTGDNKSRKYFRNYFSLLPHWLLQCIMENFPELIFDLVKRNEQEMLVPFLKNYKQAILALRDEKGNTLLHQAAMSRGFMENTIQLLRNAGFSLQAVNGDGLTPLALAQKYKRTELVKWLS
jgi:ankyrin repeat protein